MSIEELVEKIQEFNTLIQEKMKQATTLLDEGDIEEADEVINEVNELRDEVKVLREELHNAEEQEAQTSEVEVGDGSQRSEEGKEDKEEKETSKKSEETEEDKEDTSKEKEEKEEETSEKEEKESEGTENHKRSEGKMTVEREVTNNVATKLEDKYLDEHVIQRSESVEGIKNDNDGVTVPEGIVDNLGETRDEVDSLSKYATVRNVPNAVGKAYFLNQSGPVVLPTVPELNKAPQLGVVGMLEKTYELITRRGYIIVSEEAWEDADGLKEEVSYVLKRAVVDTENHEILDVFNGNSDVESVDIEVANDFIGIGLRKAFQKQFIFSTSSYNKVAKKTDNEGRSILQSDLTKPLAETILGKPVLVLDDELVGEDFAIYGDLSKAIVLFKKASVQTKWTDYLHYGRAFQVIVRQEAQILNSEAVVKLNIVEPTSDGDEGQDEVEEE